MYSAIRLNPKFLENIVILCFDSRFSKQIRIKSYTLVPPKILDPPKFWGWRQSREQLEIIVGCENCCTSGDDQTSLHIRPSGRRQITKRGTMFLYFHNNFLPTDNVSEGKADL